MEPFIEAHNDLYLTYLRHFIGRRKRALWVLGTSAAVIVLFFMVLPEDAAPLEDRSSLNITAVAPEGSTFEYTDRFMDQIIHTVSQHVPEATVLNTVTAQSASNTGNEIGRASCRERVW